MDKIKNVTGYILCGGKSKRFGSDKAVAELDGKPVVQIVADELAKVFDEVVLVTAKPLKYSFLNLENITDIYRNCGPLAGIHAALDHLKKEKAFVISCDMPLITEEVVKYIVQYPTGKDIIIPQSDGKKHYLCALYGKEVLWRAKAILEQTKDVEKCASPYDLINITGYELLDFDGQDKFDRKCFFNLNTVEDLQNLKAE